MSFGHGPTRREQEILDLSDRGLTPERIAAQLDLNARYVGNVLSRLSSPTAGDRAWNDMARHGSAKLLKAIRRHHPERCA